MSETYDFHIGDVLTVVTGKMVSPRNVVGLRGILGFMLENKEPNDTSITDMGCVALTSPGRKELIRQHPWLAKIDGSKVNPKNVDAWLAGLATKHGETVRVARRP